MEPNVNPQPNPTPEEPTEQPEESMTPVESVAPSEAASPELTAQIDDLLATSAAETTPAEAPLADQVITPTVSTPELPDMAVPEEPTPEFTAPETTTFPEPLPTEPELAPEAEAQPVTPVTEPQVVAPATDSVEPTPVLAAAPAADPVAASAVATRKRSWRRPVLLGLAVLVGLAAISAVVYAEVIVPNRPDQVLMKALENSVQQKQVSYKGSVDVDSSGTATKIDISGAQDNNAQASDLSLNVTTSGINLPVEARLVDKNVYVKVGDLTPVVSLLGAMGNASTTKVVTAVSQQLSNKWVSIDSTLLKQAGLSCYIDNKFTLTQADVKLLEDQYKAKPFATIQSTADDTVNGQKVVKYQLSIDDDKAVAYGSNLNNLSVAKTLNSCNKNAKPSTAPNSLRDHDKTPLTVWVNKGSKQIVQIASQSTSQDASKGVTGSGKISFTYGTVSVTAPSDSTPVLEVLANLEKSLGIPTTSSNGLDLTKLLSSGASASLSSQVNASLGGNSKR